MSPARFTCPQVDNDVRTDDHPYSSDPRPHLIVMSQDSRIKRVSTTKEQRAVRRFRVLEDGDNERRSLHPDHAEPSRSPSQVRSTLLTTRSRLAGGRRAPRPGGARLCEHHGSRACESGYISTADRRVRRRAANVGHPARSRASMRSSIVTCRRVRWACISSSTSSMSSGSSSSTWQ